MEINKALELHNIGGERALQSPSIRGKTDIYNCPNYQAITYERCDFGESNRVTLKIGMKYFKENQFGFKTNRSIVETSLLIKSFEKDEKKKSHMAFIDLREHKI